ncbi:hypothetical protein CF70_018080 [Cupriavidus sp. SK-3]|uniref:hypothetical protein n=1 Tax=Cupriavidus sp. SK-3 TaxID=1470558 RepID=UPI0004471493|nr:hypothetical protein [Cupriavidus sp. SK-3]KDP84727.1 hypothetical protein CF70_018080 [Cupriavidus sp. SK-3]
MLPPNTPEAWTRALRHAVRGGTPDLYGDPFHMGLYILDPNGQPRQEMDSRAHHEFLRGWFKRFILRTDLPEQNARVWTCFCPWTQSTQDPPVFLTHLIAPSVDKIFTSTTWQDAQDKHRRVAEKARRVLPLTPLPGDEDVQ